MAFDVPHRRTAKPAHHRGFSKGLLRSARALPHSLKSNVAAGVAETAHFVTHGVFDNRSSTCISPEATSSESEASTLMATIEEGVGGTDGRQSGPSDSQVDQGEIIKFLDDREAEVIFLIEGTCEVTGTTL